MAICLVLREYEIVLRDPKRQPPSGRSGALARREGGKPALYGRQDARRYSKNPCASVSIPLSLCFSAINRG
jgi:hypothetical protein